MWSWLERFLKSIQADTQEESDDKPPRVPSSSNQPQTRTKSIYPRERERTRTKTEQDEEIRGQFRFPVIPDRTKQQPRRKESTDVESPFEVYKQNNSRDHSEEVSKQASKKQEAAASRQVASKSALDKESAAFQPTQILSPIYGKIDPNKTVPTDHQMLYQTKEEKVEAKKDIFDSIRINGVGESRDTSVPHHELEQVVQKEYLLEEEQVLQEVLREEQPLETADEPIELPRMVEESQPAIEEDTEEVSVAEEIVEIDIIEEESTEIAPTVVEFTEITPTVVEFTEITPTVVEFSKVPPSVELVNHRRTEVFSSRQQVAPCIEMEEVEPIIPIMPFQQNRAPVFPVFPVDQVAPIDNTYEFPSLSLLDTPPVLSDDSYEYTLQQKQLLEETLENFHVNAQVVGIVKGPAVTRFELQPAPGVKVNKITGLSDDIKLNLAAKDIRIEAPIPGRNAVGIEVPNLKGEAIYIRRIIGSEKFQNHPSPLAIALGMDIGGEPIVADIKKMPHGLIAGSTGSGKSVCINSIIISLLYKATPEQVRLLLIDPKMVELAPYNHLPHLVTPVVTDAKQATASLKWAVEEMEKRYALFVDAGVRDIDRYNKQADQELPYIIIIIDELADLMMVSPQDVEDCIIRIAQKARACGIHLLLATQRPSVDVITGNIKANVPTRLAFAVFSQIDSRTILDQSGAERLLGRGDMLFLESGATPVRLQGNYVSDDEIDRVTEIIKNQRKPAYFFSKEDLEQSVNSYDMGDDSLFHEALVFVAEQGQASASSLQRRFRIGYNRAARLIDMMEAEGLVAGQSGGKPRAVLITVEDAQAMAEGSTLL